MPPIEPLSFSRRLCDRCSREANTFEDPRRCIADPHINPDENFRCASALYIRQIILEVVERRHDDPTFQPWIHYQRVDSQHYAMLVTEARTPDEPWWLVSWYKHRGRTEQLWVVLDQQPPRRPNAAQIDNLLQNYFYPITW